MCSMVMNVFSCVSKGTSQDDDVGGDSPDLKVKVDGGVEWSLSLQDVQHLVITRARTQQGRGVKTAPCSAVE